MTDWLGVDMDHFTHCPIPDKGGRDCWRESHPASRFGICVHHWRMVVDDWCADQPETSRACQACGALNYADTSDWAKLHCRDCGTEISEPSIIKNAPTRPIRERAVERQRPEAEGVVYYIRFGDRAKIGYTGSFSSRMEVLPHDEILAAEPGSLQVERQRHKMFEHLRINSHREWFHFDDELRGFAQTVRSLYGDPARLARKVETAVHRWQMAKELL